MIEALDGQAESLRRRVRRGQLREVARDRVPVDETDLYAYSLGDPGCGDRKESESARDGLTPRIHMRPRKPLSRGISALRTQV
jgi:hypothetical protein